MGGKNHNKTQKIKMTKIQNQKYKKTQLSLEHVVTRCKTGNHIIQFIFQHIGIWVKKTKRK